jgi:deoxycytidylate deaminase
MEKRKRVHKGPKGSVPGKIAYILHQFKRKEEIDVLRAVYGKQFFQISVYTKRSSRVDTLARKIANSRNSAEHNKFRHKAEQLVIKDENEEENVHGQQIGKIFHEADIIINTEADLDVTLQVARTVQLVFGSNVISPTRYEYGLYTAKSASLRSLDLSRQVGAAIFTPAGEIISMGSNEVPKAGGGTYWCDDPYDDRDFKRGFDSNFKRKVELLREIFKDEDEKALIQRVRKTQFMAALEYGRMIHAEMSAITDAARLGRPLKALHFSLQHSLAICARSISFHLELIESYS